MDIEKNTNNNKEIKTKLTELRQRLRRWIDKHQSYFASDLLFKVYYKLVNLNGLFFGPDLPLPLSSVIMIDKKITILIGKAIREGKYLNITYKNRSGEITPFWISVYDINAQGELRGNIFNVTKDNPILDGKIFISEIQSAEILKFSHYDVPEKLISKLDHDDSLLIYDFYRYDNNILNYYLECYKANRDPFLHQAYLIEGLDLPELVKKTPYSLTDEQQRQIIQEIYSNDYKSFNDYELALCEFSIDLMSRGKFVIAFRKLTFDPVRKTLHLASKTQFNPNFYIQGVRHSLSYYTDLSPADLKRCMPRIKLRLLKW